MKLGVLGTGSIAHTVISGVCRLEEIQCTAVAARDLERARAFAGEFGFRRAYGSYLELVEDPEVELIYITTPHALHFEHMMLCLDHGKSVLCEKPFTLNAAQARLVAEKAREKGLYAAEAIWTRYMPSRQMINRAMEDIGRPWTLSANLSYPMPNKKRIHDPALGGGALLDIGIYGLNFAMMHFGPDFARVDSSVLLTETGVDGTESLTCVYPDGRMAVLHHSVFCRSDRKGIIHGDKGYLVVENINNPQSIAVYDKDDHLLYSKEVPPQINGYENEFLEAAACLKDGKQESVSMPLEETIHVMEVMDALRKTWGLRYPGEEQL